MATTTTKPKMMMANEACVVTVGARPVEYQRRIVRDRHSGKLAEIDIHELPPIDEGDLGRSYVFRKGEKVSADHEAVPTHPDRSAKPTTESRLTVSPAHGTTKQRGYGADHKRLRRRWAREVAHGDVRCSRCGDIGYPDEPWDLGHDDHDRTRHTGPEHRGCNRATATHRATRKRQIMFAFIGNHRTLSRPW